MDPEELAAITRLLDARARRERLADVRGTDVPPPAHPSAGRTAEQRAGTLRREAVPTGTFPLPSAPPAHPQAGQTSQERLDVLRREMFSRLAREGGGSATLPGRPPERVSLEGTGPGRFPEGTNVVDLAENRPSTLERLLRASPGARALTAIRDALSDEPTVTLPGRPRARATEPRARTGPSEQVTRAIERAVGLREMLPAGAPAVDPSTAPQSVSLPKADMRISDAEADIVLPPGGDRSAAPGSGLTSGQRVLRGFLDPRSTRDLMLDHAGEIFAAPAVDPRSRPQSVPAPQPPRTTLNPDSPLAHNQRVMEILDPARNPVLRALRGRGAVRFPGLDRPEEPR